MERKRLWLDLTARDTVSGPPPCAPHGLATLQVRPGPPWGSGATTRVRTPASHACPGRPRGPGPPFFPWEGVRPATWRPGRPRGLGPSFPWEGVRPATWHPGGHNQAGPATCPVAARLPRHTSPTTAL